MKPLPPYRPESALFYGRCHVDRCWRQHTGKKIEKPRVVEGGCAVRAAPRCWSASNSEEGADDAHASFKMELSEASTDKFTIGKILCTFPVISKTRLVK